jgi:hypothetical protein
MKQLSIYLIFYLIVQLIIIKYNKPLPESNKIKDHQSQMIKGKSESDSRQNKKITNIIHTVTNSSGSLSGHVQQIIRNSYLPYRILRNKDNRWPGNPNND